MVDADIIVLPYQYLLDPKLRRSLQIDLEGSVIFFDEAHNLEGYCDDLLSVEITKDKFYSAITYLKQFHSYLLKKAAKEGSNYDCKSKINDIKYLISFFEKWS